jgi:hypothetical protein
MLHVYKKHQTYPSVKKTFSTSLITKKQKKYAKI